MITKPVLVLNSSPFHHFRKNKSAKTTFLGLLWKSIQQWVKSCCHTRGHKAANDVTSCSNVSERKHFWFLSLKVLRLPWDYFHCQGVAGGPGRRKTLITWNYCWWDDFILKWGWELEMFHFFKKKHQLKSSALYSLTYTTGF